MFGLFASLKFKAAGAERYHAGGLELRGWASGCWVEVQDFTASAFGVGT